MLEETASTVLEVTFLGNPLWRWAAGLATAVVAWAVLRLLRGAIGRRLRRFAERTTTEVDDLLLQLLDKTSGLFLFLVALLVGARFLVLSPALDLFLKRIVMVGLFVQIGLWADQVLRFALDRFLGGGPEEGDDRSRQALGGLFTFFGRLAIWSVVILLALDNFAVDVTALIAGLGLGGIAVGLALQSVLKDTFASLSIVLDKPFEVGDFIIVGSELGTVERIGIKTTRVRSLSGEQLVFGNDDLLSSRIRNFKRMFERRVVFGFGVVYQTTPDQLEWIQQTVREIVEARDNARFDRGHFKSFGDSSLDFEVVYYVLVPEYNAYMDIQQAINLELMRRLAERGIEFAYPTRTLFVEGVPAELRAG